MEITTSKVLRASRGGGGSSSWPFHQDEPASTSEDEEPNPDLARAFSVWAVCGMP